jgi:hypothetical protein
MAGPTPTPPPHAPFERIFIEHNYLDYVNIRVADTLTNKPGSLAAMDPSQTLIDYAKTLDIIDTHVTGFVRKIPSDVGMRIITWLREADSQGFALTFGLRVPGRWSVNAPNVLQTGTVPVIITCPQNAFGF